MVEWKGTILHAVVALTCCLVGLGWTAAGFYAGRELAQAEYRYIEAHGGKRYENEWFCGFLPSAWTAKSVCDWVVPVLIAAGWSLANAVMGS